MMPDYMETESEEANTVGAETGSKETAIFGEEYSQSEKEEESEDEADEIEKRLEKSMEYGTCYSLIKPIVEWVNPLCAESVSGNCNYVTSDAIFGVGLSKMSCDRTDHHKVMQFDTKYGPKVGLTMLSTLLCTRGGVITIKVHGQIYIEPTIEEQAVGFQFTLQQVQDCGWNISVEDLNELNRLMQKYGVTSKVSAYMMLATMLSESGNCTKSTEDYDGSRDYAFEVRGAGYMQLTGEDIQRAFLEAMNKSYDNIKKDNDVPTYIGDNYAIESAVWYWTKNKLPGKDSLNQYVEDYAKDKNMDGIFLITQYYVNSFPSGHNNTLQKIREGMDYKIISKNDNDGKKIYMLEADGDSFPMPVNWTDRNTKWNTAKAVMNEE